MVRGINFFLTGSPLRDCPLECVLAAPAGLAAAWSSGLSLPPEGSAPRRSLGARVPINMHSLKVCFGRDHDPLSRLRDPTFCTGGRYSL